ncbi:endonuclease/exonuclease/phosphatase family protein [Streptomyces phytophilus]|uniref:endonuclease/exonuclease/phosphatase family protein n=1 Tax=Streptomyces phytophilus TaxID=722715 RepID=UPI0015F04563|nr:endonuclease/exonuclease/phosphatase family protein [Streptomyces phytophilus]
MPAKERLLLDAMTDDILTVVQWNLESDGGPDPSSERWRRAHDILAAHGQIDIHLRQESKYSRERGHQRLHATERRLGGLRGFLSAPNPHADADIATAVFIRPEKFAVLESRPRAKPWWLHPTHVMVRLGECPLPMNIVSFHMCWFDPDQRLTEAQWLTTLAQPGMVTLAGGDTNSYPQQPDPDLTLPDWTTVTDRAHLAHRTIVEGGGRRSDTRPDEVLTTAGYVDLGRHAADHLGQPDALTPTAGRADQGGPQRIDRTYAAGGLADALSGVEVVHTDVSDHPLLITRLRRSRVERVLREQSTVAASR